MDYGFASWSAMKEVVEGKVDEKRYLHRLCGDWAAETLKRSGVPGKVRVWYDGYSDGPTPARAYDDEWFALRTRGVLDRFDSPESAILGFRNMYQELEEYPGFAEVVLWFDPCLFDQTILIQHLDWFSRRDMGKTKLSLICIGEYPGIKKFLGFAQLRPEQMASLLETRHEVTKREIDLAAEAWNIYRSPDPMAILEFIAGDTTALPYLAQAFRRHLQRFPSIRNGLNLQEQESLEAISEGHATFADIFARVWEVENLIYFNEGMLLPYLEALASGPNPLLRMGGLEFTEGIRRYEWPFKKITFELTNTGRDVLNGKEDRVALNGIDQWVGGVHLQGREADWRWDEESDRLVKM